MTKLRVFNNIELGSVFAVNKGIPSKVLHISNTKHMDCIIVITKIPV